MSDWKIPRNAENDYSHETAAEATGQDEANVVELHVCQTFIEVLDNGDLYWSWTMPSPIVATYGGGAGLSTQR